jgi:hypothetical protein
MKKNLDGADSEKGKPSAERSSGTVIEAQFPAEAESQCEQQIPIFIRFLANKERIWRPGKRNWDWRVPHDCQGDLVCSH